MKTAGNNFIYDFVLHYSLQKSQKLWQIISQNSFKNFHFFPFNAQVKHFNYIQNFNVKYEEYSLGHSKKKMILLIVNFRLTIFLQYA